MATYRTPGVYIVEKNAFPNSIVEVATAVPAFIGYTEKADNGGTTLLKKPWRITSMADFTKYYGGPPKSQFTIREKKPNEVSTFKVTAADGDKECVLQQVAGKEGGQFLLYRSMLHFFQNGGGPCFVVSVGDYTQDLDPSVLKGGVAPLVKEQEPTMVVVPDAVLLKEDACIDVQQEMLRHCGSVMKNRFAILDVWGGFNDRQAPDPAGDCVAKFRDALGTSSLNFAAAYYPWIHTTVVQEREVDYSNIKDDTLKLGELLKGELGLMDPAGADTPKGKQQVAVIANMAKTDDAWKTELTAKIDGSTTLSDDLKKAAKKPEALNSAVETNRTLTNGSLKSMSPLFVTLMTEVRNQLNLIPPAAAMAGIYTMVDNARGVWKAPANVSLNGVTRPAVNISTEEQEDLNVSTQGKSINAIRSFIGEGVLVWGARTLDGNSLDWRYINVRRTMIMLEESCRLAAKAMVFEPNVAGTWVTMKSMIGNFLTGIWKRGGLAGAVPGDAFQVLCGLGETMSPEDILEGILRVTVLVAISRPAEFIEITFQQQMQKS